MNYCKDCKHLNGELCYAPQNKNLAHPVYGFEHDAVARPTDLRAHNRRCGQIVCGPGAIWFSPKEQPAPEYRPLVMGEIVPKGSWFQFVTGSCWYPLGDSIGKPYTGKTISNETIAEAHCPANLKPVFPEPEIKRCKICGGEARVRGVEGSWFVSCSTNGAPKGHGTHST